MTFVFGLAFGYVGLLLVLNGQARLRKDVARLAGRVGRVEALLTDLAATQGIRPPRPTISVDGGQVLDDDLLVRLRALVDDGKKLQAIKELRAATGMDLRTAKDTVDKL